MIHLMIHFLCTELKKLIVPEIFYKFKNNFFSTGTAATNKLDDGIPVTYFSGVQLPVFVVISAMHF